MINFFNSRKKANLTQEVVAAKLGVAKNTVSQWENGKRQPDFETLCNLSKLYNVSIDELLGNERFLNIQMPQNSIIIDFGPINEARKKAHVILQRLPDNEFYVEFGRLQTRADILGIRYWGKNHIGGIKICFNKN